MPGGTLEMCWDCLCVSIEVSLEIVSARTSKAVVWRRLCRPVCGVCAGRLWGPQALAFGRRVGGSRTGGRKGAHGSLCALRVLEGVFAMCVYL